MVREHLNFRLLTLILKNILYNLRLICTYEYLSLLQYFEEVLVDHLLVRREAARHPARVQVVVKPGLVPRELGEGKSARPPLLLDGDRGEKGCQGACRLASRGHTRALANAYARTHAYLRICVTGTHFTVCTHA